MSVTQEQLDDFYQIASDRIQQSGVDSPQELFDLWNLLHPAPSEVAEIDDSIRRGQDDIRAGRGRPAREAADELQRKYSFPE